MYPTTRTPQTVHTPPTTTRNDAAPEEHTMSINPAEPTPADPWSAFEHDLLEILADLPADTSMDVGLSRLLSAEPFASFTLTPAGLIRCTTGCELPIPTLDHRPAEALMRASGWRHLATSDRFMLEATREELPDLVDTFIETLSDIWYFDSPSELAIHTPRPIANALADYCDALDPFPPTDLPVPDDRAITAACPMDDCELADLVVSALSRMLDHPLTIDDQHCVTLPALGAHQTQVYVANSRILFAVTITHRLTDHDLLGAVIAEESDRCRHISFIVTSDHVYAQRTVEAIVFHPANLVQALDEWQHFLVSIVPTLHERLNPGGPGAHACSHSRIPIGLQTLMELDADGPGLTPERVLHLTNRKADKLRGYLSVCSEMRDEWRQDRRDLPDDADPETRELHDDAIEYFDHYVMLLTCALSVLDIESWEVENTADGKTRKNKKGGKGKKSGKD